MISKPSSFRLPARSTALAVLFAAASLARAGTVEKTEPKHIDPPAPEESKWKVTLGVPSWLAATSGKIGVDGQTASVYLGADELLRDLDMTAAFQLDVRYQRFGFYSDFLYVSASDGIGFNGLVGKVDVRLDEYLVDMDFYYRILEGPQGFLDLRAGVRYTNLYNKNTISPNDDEIQRAADDLVDDVGRRVRRELERLDLRGRVRAALDSKLAGITSDRPSFPIAPLGNDRPGVVDNVVRAAINRRVNDLAAALRAERDATTERIREEARRRVDSIKRKISREIATRLTDELDASFSVAEQWWDPYVGFRAQWNFGRAFYLKAKADIGGFGVGSDITWQASGYLGCNITRHIYAEAGYRYLYTDYDQNNFIYKVSQSGVEVTAGINF